MVGYVLQGIGLVWLLLYVVLLFEAGFAQVDWVMVVFPSILFVIGRAIHFWVAFQQRRR